MFAKAIYLSRAQAAGREFGSSMLTISGLKSFYYLPTFHDMCCKARRVSEIICTRYHRDPLNGDVTYLYQNKGHERGRITRTNINEGTPRAAGIIETCKRVWGSFRDYFRAVLKELGNGRKDNENLLPMTIGIKRNN